MNGTVEAFLAGKRVLSFDSMLIIYFIEEHQQYLPVAEAIFEQVDAGSVRALSSYITLIEVLIVAVHLSAVRFVLIRDRRRLHHRRGNHERAGDVRRSPERLRIPFG